jgi:hypothetical protein
MTKINNTFRISFPFCFFLLVVFLGVVRAEERNPKAVNAHLAELYRESIQLFQLSAFQEAADKIKDIMDILQDNKRAASWRRSHHLKPVQEDLPLILAVIEERIPGNKDADTASSQTLTAHPVSNWDVEEQVEKEKEKRIQGQKMLKAQDAKVRGEVKKKYVAQRQEKLAERSSLVKAQEQNTTLVKNEKKQRQEKPSVVIKQKRAGIPPLAKIRMSTSRGASPLTVHFYSNKCYSWQGKIVSYEWDFGDSFKSREPNPVHTFWNRYKVIPLTYAVKLTVRNDHGAEASAVATVTVESELPPS